MRTDKSLAIYTWGIKTKGNLHALNKLNLLMKAIAMKIKGRKSYLQIDFDIAKIELPDSKLVKITLEYSADIHREPLKNHFLRAFTIGDIFGNVVQIKCARELYALSALLHDLGMEDSHCGFHNEIDCFAIEGVKEVGKLRRL